MIPLAAIFGRRVMEGKYDSPNIRNMISSIIADMCDSQVLAREIYPEQYSAPPITYGAHVVFAGKSKGSGVLPLIDESFSKIDYERTSGGKFKSENLHYKVEVKSLGSRVRIAIRSPECVSARAGYFLITINGKTTDKKRVRDITRELNS